MSVIYDYTLRVNISEGAPSLDLSYLKKVCAVAKPNASGTDGEIVTINDPSEIINYTDNISIAQLFASGATSIYLLTKNDLDISSFLESNISNFITVLITEDYIQSDIDGLTVGSFGQDGVVGWVSNVEADYKAFAILSNRCGFRDDVPLSQGMMHAFQTMFNSQSGRIWKGQQYISQGSSNVTTVGALGVADDLFANRVSFYLQDNTTLGTRLAFFGAGGNGITYYYIRKQIALTLQQIAFDFIATTQPTNNAVNRASLESLMRVELQEWLDSGMLTDFTLRVESVTTERFKGFYSGTVSIGDPLWRGEISVQEV